MKSLGKYLKSNSVIFGTYKNPGTPHKYPWQTIAYRIKENKKANPQKSKLANSGKGLSEALWTHRSKEHKVGFTGALGGLALLISQILPFNTEDKTNLQKKVPISPQKEIHAPK